MRPVHPALVAVVCVACGARVGLEDPSSLADSGLARDGAAPMADTGVPRRCRAARVRPDFNGDGVGDLALGTNDGARIYLGVRGRPPAATPSSVLQYGPGAPSGNGNVAYVGDVNRDGFGDVVIYRVANIPQEPVGPARHGIAALHLGSAAGVDPRASVVLQAPAGIEELFPANVAGAGDVNADGYDDVVAGSVQSGGVALYFGGPNGLRLSSTVVQRGMAAGIDASWFVRGIGDFNNDGFDDVAVAGEGEARIFLGDAMGLSDAHSLLVVTDRAGRVGPYLDGVGDVNGDGCPDAMLLFFSPAENGLFLVPGGNGDVVCREPFEVRLPNGRAAPINGASDFLFARDLDRDGFSDVFFSGTCLTVSPCPDRPRREQVLARGHADATPARTALNATAQGDTVRSVGDLDGDGTLEVVARSITDNSVRVHRWSAEGPSPTALVTLTLPPAVTFSTSAVGTAL